MAKNYMAKLQKLEGAVVGDYNPYSFIIRTPSPSVNFTFGNTHGLPLGFTMMMYGPPKGGKSVLCNAMIGQMHKDYEDGFAVKFNTEMREMGQLTPSQAALWGIDRERYIAYDVNTPDLIFDRIEKELSALCDEGMPLKLVIIDSINAIQGRRSMNADSIMVQQIGDLALTLQEGLKRILPIQRKHKFAVILTAHVRAEMDQGEQMRGNKVKPGASFGTLHLAEYFMFVEPNRTKEGRSNALGQELVDEELGDMRKESSERTGHKIRIQMKDSSMGPKMRVGEFTLDYHNGIVSTHEEVFTLGVNRGIIEKPNNLSYAFGDRKWTGKPAMLEALRSDTDLAESVLKELRRRDMEGHFKAADVAAAEEDAPEESV